MNQSSMIVRLMCLVALAGPAASQPRHGGGGHGGQPGRGEHGRPAGGWHGDIRHFRDRDFGRWHSGHWYHGSHGGDSGWWWIVGPTWYYYRAPIYPYPDPYQPPPLAGIAPLPPPGAPPQYWYYCADPPGYFPYVSQCWVSWRPVPAQ